MERNEWMEVFIETKNYINITMRDKNPFSKIRTEQMGSSAWKYFVEPAKDYIGAKPLIFEGSRGTGKTMFFLCNSWRDKLEEAKSKGYNLIQFLEHYKHLGFYYKVDGRFVKSLSKKNIEDWVWIGIFNTYFNSVIAKEIILFYEYLISEGILETNFLQDTLIHLSLMLEVETIKDLCELNHQLDITLLKIEKFSNNTEKEKPVGLNAGTIIEKLILAGKRNDKLCNSTFHIFIDEYEELSRIQQIELNTLLKQSNYNIVYDFGVITKGIQTYETGSGQEIRLKDDFNIYSTDSYGYYEKTEYSQLLKEICKKRFAAHLETSEEKYLDISFYLKNYGKKYEEDLFEKSPELKKINDRIRTEIEKHATFFHYNEDEINFYYENLTNVQSIPLRMHLALLLRRNKNMIPAKDLVLHKNKNSRKYQDWIHNTETAVIYLLCNELKIDKKYHGFSVYSALSSGIIRSFLELAEYAFDYAFNNTEAPFSFDSPRELTVEEQTKAVYFVSNFKVKEIDSYEPYGYRLRDFTRALGKIFNAIQTNSNATLGEVEQNHFVTKVNELKKHDAEAAELLRYSIRNKILEEDNPTKTKSEEIIEFTDYHLNHIYCPAFKISHLRKRKIQISHLDLAKLFCGTHKELEEAVRRISNYQEYSDFDEPNLFSQPK